jgi:hypothetical protein
MQFVVLFVIFSLWLIQQMRIDLRKGQEAMHATFADCDMDSKLSDWMQANPNRHINCTASGRLLVKEKILTHQHFLNTHTFIDGNRHLDFLKSLLENDEDTRPKPKRKKPKDGNFRPR